MAPRESAEDALDALLAAAPDGSALSAAEVEAVLTDGYAQVLRLEVKRRALLEQMKSARDVELVTRRLLSLRDRLDEAKRRFGTSGQRHLDGRPIADDRVDEQSSP